MIKQYAVSIVFTKKIYEKNRTIDRHRLLSRTGTIKNDDGEIKDDEETKQEIIDSTLKEDKDAFSFLKDGYSVFLTTVCILDKLN